MKYYCFFLVCCIFFFLISPELLAQDAPSAPSQLRATAVSQDQINLTWVDNSDNEDFFIIERKRGLNGAWGEIAEVGPNVESFSDQPLSSAVTYFYRLKAKGTCILIDFPRDCFSPYSNEANSTTLQFPPKIDDIPDPAPINEDAGQQTIQLTGISDGDDDVVQTVSIVASSGNTTLIPDPTVNYTNPNTTGSLTYTPTPNKSGTAIITVTVIDNGGGNNTVVKTFTVRVNPVNDPPNLNNISNPSAINEDSGDQTIDLSGINAGPDENQPLTVTATSDNKNLIPDPVVSYTSPNNTGSLRYRPLANASGSATITVTVSDSDNATTTREFEVTVLPVNDPPTLDLIADPAPLPQDAPEQSIQLTGISAGPGEQQTISISTSSDNKTLIPDPTVEYTSPNATGVLRFKPSPGLAGTAQITVTVKDNGGTQRGGIDIFQRTFTIVVIKKPDLIINDQTVSPTVSGAGQFIEVNSSVANRGKQQAIASVLAYYLSSKPDFDDTAVRLGEDEVKALDPDESVSINNTLQIPAGTSVGEYYIFFFADEGNVVDEFDETNNVKSVEIAIENLPPQITGTNFPSVFTSGSQTESISISITDDSGIDDVTIQYRGISETDWKNSSVNVSSSVYTFPLNDDIFDNLGLEYFFEIVDEGGIKVLSDTGYTYIRYPGDGLTIPSIKTGTTVNNYQIIAMPLVLNSSSGESVFEDDLGNYDKRHWRLFHFEAENDLEFKEGLNIVTPGLGYWLIVRNDQIIDTGIGSTVPVTKSDPFAMDLKKGWNQIGNPYNFNLSWQDVLDHNGNPEGVGNLRIFENGFKDSNRLDRFKGAFVFSEEDVTLEIPVVKNKSVNSGGRMGGSPPDENIKGDGSWEMNFSLQTQTISYVLGGLGMHKEASLNKDVYDRVSLPRFQMLNYLEMKFDHPEHFYKSFTKDVVPIVDEYIWHLDVGSDLKGEDVILKWEKNNSNGPFKRLVLFDVKNQKVIDMHKHDEYTFSSSVSHQFQVLYGSMEFINENLKPAISRLGNIYPNPVNEVATIPFTLPESKTDYEVRIEIYNAMGKLIKTLPIGHISPGFHEYSWNREKDDGNKAEPGLYFMKLHVSFAFGKKEFIRKIIVQ